MSGMLKTSSLDSSPQKSFLQIQETAKKLQFQKPQKEFQSSLSKLNKELERVRILRIIIFLCPKIMPTNKWDRNSNKILQSYTIQKHLQEKKV